MSEKSLYKKLVDTWFDADKSQQRARENQFYEKANSEKVGVKPKSKAKPNPRADHRHEYAPVVIWRQYVWCNEIGGSVGERCRICGKSYRDYHYKRYEEPHIYYGEMEHFWEENDKLTPIDKNTYRKTIFLGGSQTVNVLTVEVKNKLVDFMNLGHKFVIGDCKGADLEIQKFLAENGYKNVVVYYSGDRARINIGGWEEKNVGANKFDKGYELYKRKDEQMAADADEGFMILKGATRGTIANIERLIALNKECAVAYSDKRARAKRLNTPVYDVRSFTSDKDVEWLKEYFGRLKNG